MSKHTNTATDTSIRIQFTPLDTWFFREARPHGSVGNSELGSVFPPPVRTLLGAVRTLMGDAWFARYGSAEHKDWRSLATNQALQALIGIGDDLGPLRVTGPFLQRNGQRLYPAPANLMVKEQDGKAHYFLLDLGEPVHCDLGRVHLPCFPKKVPGLKETVGSKPTEKYWLTQQGYTAVLTGMAPQAQDVLASKDLWTEEDRLGIGRDNRRASVQEGLLYQTRHLRLQPGISVEIELYGVVDPSLLPSHTVLRLGGEGRSASVHAAPCPTPVKLPHTALGDKVRTLALYALTPAPCYVGVPAGIPAGFVPSRHQGYDCWSGQLAGKDLRVLAVACQRPLREGGWDLVQHQARPVHSLLAPGSVLYVQSDTPISAATLHALTDQADASGRGLMVVGKLPQNTTFQG